MTTPAGKRLTEAHRLTQLKIGTLTVAQLHTVWPLLDPRHLDETFDQWLKAALPVIRAHRTASATVAASYIAAAKKVELGPSARVAPVLADPIDVEGVTTSLMVTGPVSIKAAMSRGTFLDLAVDIAEASAAAAGMRWALDGGRDTITATVKADPQATGWARVASGNACAYCSDLDGVEFSGPDGDVFPCHDGCACTAEPVFA